MSAMAGNILMVVGILIILFSLYLGYGLYESVISKAYSPVQQQGQGSGINATLSNINSSLGTLTLNVSTFIYFGVAVLLLFLFASIGYKIVDLGIKMVHLSDEESQSAQASGRGKSR